MTGLHAVTGAGVPATLEVDLAASPAELLVRQRFRLADRLARLAAPGWYRPTRCPLWDVADVVTHLGDATLWALAATGGLDTAVSGPGSARGFDPSTTPHEQVLAGRGQPPQVLLARLREQTTAFAARLHDTDGPAVPTAPWVAGLRYTPGLVGMHILWDSWLHELDLDAALGAGGIPPREPCGVELEAVAAYGIFFTGAVTRTRLPPDGELELHVELDHMAYQLRISATVRLRRAEPGASARGARVVRGPALATVEALAGRGELADVADGDTDAIALMSGLGARMRAPAQPTST